MRWFSVVLVFCMFSLYSQGEKKLALVIGNSNYENELKNPVNDARLIASVLDSLSFDVILKENLETDRDFKDAILEFGSKRSSYEIGFIYYAGHGIQIDGVNYLLPTKEVFNSEEDVSFYAFDVQNLMKLLGKKTDQANILILDACRDNPYEKNWNLTRSSKNSSGLAKMPPPTGSLIAFSTESGATAPDGKGTNSIYTLSLAKNLLIKDVSIDQVFRNVRAEVLKQSDNKQRPSEESKLTGGALVLNPSSFDLDYSLVNDILMGKGKYAYDYVKALQILNIILSKEPNNLRANQYLLETYLCMGQEEKGRSLLSYLIELYDEEAYFLFIRSLFNQELMLDLRYDDDKIKKLVLKDLEASIALEPGNPIHFYNKARFLAYFNYDKLEEAIELVSVAIEKHLSLLNNAEEPVYFGFEEPVRGSGADVFFKKTSFSIEGFYNLRLRLYLFFGDYKKACEDVNSALNYLLQNEDKHYNLLARLERGIETSLMYLQEAINNGEEFCAKNN